MRSLYDEADQKFFDEQDDVRPRSRLILQELAENETERDSFARLKTSVSPAALKGLSVLALALLLALVMIQFLRSTTQSVDEPGMTLQAVQTPVSVESPSELASATVFVHVAGAVKSPGVYELDTGQRVTDALEAAGGAIDPADLTALNLAAPLQDGEKIYVPEQGETVESVAPQEVGSGTGASSQGLVNLNTASAEELQTLPRVGPATAEKIIAYREQVGRFTSLDDLLAVPGIGEKTIDQFEGLVTF